MSTGTVLGIDLGANSLGTALIDTANRRVVFTGVRIFDSGVDALNQAGEASRNLARRQARQQRKQTDRRRRRHVRLFALLQQSGMLPDGQRREVLRDLDRDLYRKYPSTHALPYFLRARGLDQPLEIYELGRALYHLGQRRGFESNRRAPRKDEKDRGKVDEGISTLAEQMSTAGARTLGEYFAGLNPHSPDAKIRRLGGVWIN